MRKVFWCCVAAGAAACGALGTAAYVARHPDSALGRCAHAVCPVASHDGAAGVASAVRPGVIEADDLVPADPVPVDDAPPLPAPGSHVPPEVAALLAPPPIVIHDEEDLNPQPNPAHAYADAGRPTTAGFSDLARRLDDEAPPAAGPAPMPYCVDDDGPTGPMPYCSEDGAPAEARDLGPTGAAPCRDFDPCAFWVGFFTAPTRLFGAAHDRCEEDVHYPQQYSGAPYTGEPAANPKPLPALPESVEQDAPPAPHNEAAAPARPNRLKQPAGEPRSDTMEMRPSDWKPYSLAPGPF